MKFIYDVHSFPIFLLRWPLLIWFRAMDIVTIGTRGSLTVMSVIILFPLMTVVAVSQGASCTFINRRLNHRISACVTNLRNLTPYSDARWQYCQHGEVWRIPVKSDPTVHLSHELRYDQSCDRQSSK